MTTRASPLNYHHMAHELRVISPGFDFALGQRGRQIDDAPVRRSPETQRDVVMRLYKRAVHQHIDSRKQAIGHLGMTCAFGVLQILKQVARVAPHHLPRIRFAHALDEINQCALVFRLHRLAAQKGQTINVFRCQALENLILHLRRKRLPRREIPLLGVETTRAPMTAPRNEQAGAHALAVGNIEVFDLRVIHIPPAPFT